MERVCCNAEYAVFEDVLSKDELRRFWDMFCNTEFEDVQARRLERAYRFSDGVPLSGPFVSCALDPGDAPRVRADAALRVHPTGEAYDSLLAAVLRAAASCSALIGRERESWQGVFAQLQAFPQGASLAWRSEAPDTTGSFVFFANPYWDVQWGGELLVAGSGTRGLLPPGSAAPAHDGRSDPENEILMADGIGTYVLPKPNRLVLLAGSRPYKLVKVSPAAGDSVRACLSGAFVTREGMLQRSARWLDAG